MSKLSACFLIFSFCISAPVASKIQLYSSDASYPDILKSSIKSNEISNSYTTLLYQIRETYNLRLMPFSRAMKYIKHRDQPACVLFAGKTKQRLHEFWFSLPLTVIPPMHLYQKIGDSVVEASQLNKRGELVSLNALITSDASYSLVVVQGISYGDKLDNEVKNLPNEQLYKIVLFNAENPVYDILAKRDIDFALMHPSSMQKQDTSKLRAYKISGIGNFRGNHIVCNRTQETRDWLSMVNKKLATLYHDPEFIEQVLMHSPPSARASLTLQLRSISGTETIMPE